ncbi:MAG: DNA polymerase beta, partial [Desulfobacteraceae bacterium]|nr:DNA polymerase beta [Desulfobacteraceae bacterium]MCP4107029.1 DNA polymerase beta [Desulfobacteraceae bacterium]
MKQIEEIRKTLKDHKDCLRNEYGVTEIGIFGSYVKGMQKESSD